jgi:hypothetical protein
VIVLDTNVLSELLRAEPDTRVTAWLVNQPRGSLYTTTVTEAEILYGVSILPDGKRRHSLLAATTAIFHEDFANRLLAFDSDAAGQYAAIGAQRRALGRPISQFDAMIAAMARSRGAALASRNTRDFADCGIELINPWNA